MRRYLRSILIVPTRDAKPFDRKPWDLSVFRVGTVGVCPKVESLDSYRHCDEIYWNGPKDQLVKKSAGSMPTTQASGAIRP
jgi:hypothetical protein